MKNANNGERMETKNFIDKLVDLDSSVQWALIRRETNLRDAMRRLIKEAFTIGVRTGFELASKHASN